MKWQNEQQLSKERGTMNKPELDLTRVDGNAFSLLGQASRVARRNKMDWEKIQREATSGDYNKLLATLSEYFEIII